MSNPFTLYEERRVLTRPGRFEDYLTLIRDHIWPAVHNAGGQALVLLNGLIGAAVEETFLVTGFTGFEAWRDAQGLMTGMHGTGNGDVARRRSELVSEETVSLMAPSPYRPDPIPSVENRRPVYGARRFFIDPADLEEFERLSFEGVWPAMDEMDHRVLGQFHPVGITDSFAVLNLAGYWSPAHWHETRSARDPASGTSDSARERLRTDGEARRRLVKHSRVCLLSSHWPD